MKKIFIYILLSFQILWVSNIFAVAPFSGDVIIHYDAQDIDADGNTITGEPSNNSNISSWQDAGNSFTGSQIILAGQPIYQTWAIAGELPWIKFDGNTDILEVLDQTEINLDEEFSQKSFAFVIETGTDVTSLQTIYEQWTHLKWYWFQIIWWNLYWWVWNVLDWSPWDQYKIIDYGSISTDETYYITFVHDNWTVSWYLDGWLVTSLSWADTQTIHGICRFDTFFWCSLYGTGGTIGIGATQNDTINLSNQNAIQMYQWNYFTGSIWEIISWDSALSSWDIDTVNTYFIDRWETRDTTSPIISTFTPQSWSLLPWGSHNINISYSDTETNASGIDISPDRSIRFDKNIAPRASISASPTAFNSYGTWWIANGVISTSWDLDYEYHSSSGNAFIEFDYGANPEYIWAMRIYNRVWCCSNRLSNATVQLYDNSNTLVYTHTLWNTTWVNEINIDFKALWEIHNVSRVRLSSVWGSNFINIREIEIFPLEYNLSLQKWNGSSWWDDISDIYVNFTGATKTTTNASYNFISLPYWKYRASYTIADIAENTTKQEAIFYIDEPEFTVSSWSLNIWTIDSFSNYYSDELIVTVKTVWAAHNVLLKSNTDLQYLSENILPFSTLGYWYDLWPTYSSSISNIWNTSVIGAQAENINTDGNKNTYTYRVKIWTLIDSQQAAGDYEWLIDIWIELDY